MNLYRDPWIPVRGATELLSLQRLLCGQEGWQLAMPRDDMELACLQLLISLVQVALMPKDRDHWRERLAHPILAAEYEAAVSPLADWFELDHPRHPFMQTRGVVSEDVVPIQKLFIGLPAGNNHTHFNAPGEIRRVGSAAAAVALFNQAINSPGISSGLEVGLRKASVASIVVGESLRDSLWRNVLHAESVASLHGSPEVSEQRPVWVVPRAAGERAESLGLLRGLFWQPKQIELIADRSRGTCDFLGTECDATYIGFRWRKESRKVEGFWLDPLTPSRLTVEKGKAASQRSLAFTNATPSWRHCTNLIASLAAGQKGERAAPVVDQWGSSTSGAMNLIVGGYCRQKSNEEKLLARRHETYSLGQGWNEPHGKDSVRWAVTTTDTARTALWHCVTLVAEDALGSQVQKRPDRRRTPLQNRAETQFFAATESLIHGWLRNMTRSERRAEKKQFVSSTCAICEGIYERLTSPYAHDPALVSTIALARKELGDRMNKLRDQVREVATT